MVHKMITKRVADAFIKDEKQAVKDYHNLGLPDFADDEARHLAYWKKVRRLV